MHIKRLVAVFLLAVVSGCKTIPTPAPPAPLPVPVTDHELACEQRVLAGGLSDADAQTLLQGCRDAWNAGETR